MDFQSDKIGMFKQLENYISNVNIETFIFHPVLKSIVVAVMIFLVFLLLRKFFTRYLFNWLLKMTAWTQNDFDDKILRAFEKPLRVFFIGIGIFLALRYLPLSVVADILILKLFRTMIIILIGWGLYDLSDTQSVFSEELQKKFNIDAILFPFFAKVFRFIIIAFILLIIAGEWDYDVNGLIAGLGLGGLAFALAAKDAASNIFGGIIIIMEKPFSIGDWIVTPSVEGIVEDISFRSTRIRAFAQSIITVPNSTLANEAITNYSRMGKRRITFHLGVTYDTPRHKLEKVVKEIKQMLIDHPDIHKETIFVNFETFNDSSLDIFLYFFTNTTNWGEFLDVKQDVNLKIMSILEKEEVSVAFPSRSIYIETPQVVEKYDMNGENLS